MQNSQIRKLLRPGCRVHLIGVGGVSMSALAGVLYSRGLIVTGSDRQAGPVLDELARKGLTVYPCEDAAHLMGVDAVIRTAAAREDNAEVAAARALKRPLLERAEAWGMISREYARSLCIAGTHGKTTTTGMAAHIAMAAGADPTVMVGGALPLLDGTYRVGRGDLIILEACEYKNSYHSFFATTAVILNIDADHLDFFPNMDAIIASFQKFARSVSPGGYMIGNADDSHVRSALAGLENVLWFGSRGADVTAQNVSVGPNGCYAFDITARDKSIPGVELRVPGRHNLCNALAAAAAALTLDLPSEAIREGLGSFTGAGRRMEYHGTLNGAALYDDYAHHPSEIRTTLEAAAGMGHSRVLCLFQPHTYSRTRLLYDAFVEALALADKVFLADIYAAREPDPGDVSSCRLAGDIPGAVYCPDLPDMAAAVCREARPGDMILTMGAGDINRVLPLLKKSCPSS